VNIQTPTKLAGCLAACILFGPLGCGRKSGAAAPQPAPPATASQAAAPLPSQAPPARALPPTVIEVPAGTRLKVSLGRALATDRDQAGAAWEGTLADPVAVQGQVVWPKGAPVRGVVAQSSPAGRLKGGQGGLGLRIASVAGRTVKTSTFTVAGERRAGRNAKYIGGTAALGALVGALTSHGHQADHALGGAAIGAAAGTGLAAGTADTVVRIPAGRVMAFSLASPAGVTSKR
jgi:hypothetical protein